MADERDEQGYDSRYSTQERQFGFNSSRDKKQNTEFILCPACPEIKSTQIEMKKKLDRIDIAILGSDGTGLNDGIVHEITELQKNTTITKKITESWIKTIRPIVTFIIGSLVTAAITYLIITLH